MIKINRIYTRTGDQGTTGLAGGSRVRKNSLRVKTYGEIDELNSYLGWARTLAEQAEQNDIRDQLAVLQNSLFDLGAYLATSPDKAQKPPAPSSGEIAALESSIDSAIEGLPELRSFVLPGGSPLNSALHIARTVCRRCERQLLDLMDKEQVDENALIYLNRLSDLLFALARNVSHRNNQPEYLWQAKKN